MDGKMYCFIDLLEYFEISKIILIDKNVVFCVVYVFILYFLMLKIFLLKNLI